MLGLLALAMYISCIFHVVCVSFSALATRKLADAKAVFSGIWASDHSLQSVFVHTSGNVQGWEVGECLRSNLIATLTTEESIKAMSQALHEEKTDHHTANGHIHRSVVHRLRN